MVQSECTYLSACGRQAHVHAQQLQIVAEQSRVHLTQAVEVLQVEQ